MKKQQTWKVIQNAEKIMKESKYLISNQIREQNNVTDHKKNMKTSQITFEKSFETCKKCQAKEIQIKVLIKQLKTLQQCHEKQISQLKSTIQYQLDHTIIHPNLDTWKNKCQNLQKKLNQIENFNKHSLNQKKLIEENLILKEQINTLEKKINQLKQTNYSPIKTQLLDHNNEIKIHQLHRPLTPTFSISSQAVFPQPATVMVKSKPKLSSLKQSMGNYSPLKSNQLGREYFPLSVFQNVNDEKINSNNNKTVLYYERDLIVEKQKALARKIQILQNQNIYLRQQFKPLFK